MTAGIEASWSPETLRGQLLAWFQRRHRDLPWRSTSDPYSILVSEFMLQQTRVETVLRYYTRFLERFSSFEELARSDLDEVLAQWSGLGYYRRARSLHAAAQAVVAGGGLPESAQELRSLPGIGSYTAAAVASIAFGEVVPVLDGNVERVLARRLALEQNPKHKAARAVLEKAASELLDLQAPGDSNQALMELGAVVCKPRNPLCGDCVLRPGCRAAETGTQETYPLRPLRREQVKERLLVARVEQEGRLLLIKRDHDSGLLAGLWELPWVPLGKERVAEWADLFARRYGGDWTLAARGAKVRHTITHRDLHVEVRTAHLETDEGIARESGAGETGWWSLGQLDELPLGALVRKCLAADS